jgi:4-oxalocrotonate tautomerase
MPVIQITMSQGRSVEQTLTRETARIMKTDEEKVRILIYEVSRENWGNAGILGTDIYVIKNEKLYTLKYYAPMASYQPVMEAK